MVTERETADEFLIHLDCPVCHGPILLNLTMTGEGEDQYPLLQPKASSVISIGDCKCDFSRPFIEVWAEYLNDPEQLKLNWTSY